MHCCVQGQGCEVANLRQEDIKQEAKSIYYFDFKHEPKAEYSTTVKGGGAGERRMPWHQLVMEQD